MKCKNCNSEKYLQSPIEGVCVVCAVKDWRICKTKLSSYRIGKVDEKEDLLKPTKSSMGKVKCKGSFEPEFMYDMYCKKCWERKVSNTEEKGKDKFFRICVVCGDSFRTEKSAHHLCDNCKNEWLSCSASCKNYFKPYEGRFSESLCFECRKGKYENTADLLSIISYELDVEMSFNKEIHSRM